MLVEVPAPGGDLVGEVGDAVDDRHEKPLAEMMQAPTEADEVPSRQSQAAGRRRGLNGPAQDGLGPLRAELAALDRHEDQHHHDERGEPPDLRGADAEAAERIGRGEGRHDARAEDRAVACRPRRRRSRGARRPPAAPTRPSSYQISNRSVSGAVGGTRPMMRPRRAVSSPWPVISRDGSLRMIVRQASRLATSGARGAEEALGKGLEDEGQQRARAAGARP